jgi:hypothetical protein
MPQISVISVIRAVSARLEQIRDERVQYLAQALASGFTRSELKQLMAVAPLLERLAQSV